MKGTITKNTVTRPNSHHHQDFRPYPSDPPAFSLSFDPSVLFAAGLGQPNYIGVWCSSAFVFAGPLEQVLLTLSQVESEVRPTLWNSSSAVSLEVNLDRILRQ